MTALVTLFNINSKLFEDHLENYCRHLFDLNIHWGQMVKMVTLQAIDHKFVPYWILHEHELFLFLQYYCIIIVISPVTGCGHRVFVYLSSWLFPCTYIGWTPKSYSFIHNVYWAGRPDRVHLSPGQTTANTLQLECLLWSSLSIPSKVTLTVDLSKETLYPTLPCYDHAGCTEIWRSFYLTAFPDGKNAYVSGKFLIFSNQNKDKIN